MGLDSEKRLFLRNEAKIGIWMPKEPFMMHMMQYKLVISDSTIVQACYDTNIRISEIFNAGKKM